jgi:hypothetical protein
MSTAASNSATIGTAIAHMENGSVEGVATAAKTKIRKMATRCDLRGQDHDQGQLEGDAEGDQHLQHEREVAVHCQQCHDVWAGLAEQERQPSFEDEVGQHRAQREQQRGGQDEGDGEAAFFLAQSRRDEGPDLVQPQGGGQRGPGREGHLEAHVEPVEHAVVHKHTAAIGASEPVAEVDVAVGPFEQPQDRVVEVPPCDRAGGDDDQRDDESAAQLAQVVERRHAAFGVLAAAADAAGGAGHGRAAGVTAVSAAARLRPVSDGAVDGTGSRPSASWQVSVVVIGPPEVQADHRSRR